jgi:hypothetical protein
MNAETRHEAIALISAIMELSEEVRLGQLLAHLQFLAEIETARPLSDAEDEEVLHVLRRHKAELLGRSKSVSAAPDVSELPTTPAAQVASDARN